MTKSSVKKEEKSKSKDYSSLEKLDYYLNLKYKITITPEPEGGFVVEIKSLPGCITQVETEEEIFTNINDAKKLWLETALEHGDKIPLPSYMDSDYSGKFMLRMSPDLHQSLAKNASQEGESLNKHTVNLITKAKELWELQKKYKNNEQRINQVKEHFMYKTVKQLEDNIQEAVETFENLAKNNIV